MKVIHTGIFSIIKKFPEQKNVIRRLLKKNDSFMTLCEDYRICEEALEHWKLSESDEAPLRRNEYRSLLQELEAEIIQNVKNLKNI